MGGGGVFDIRDPAWLCRSEEPAAPVCLRGRAKTNPAGYSLGRGRSVATKVALGGTFVASRPGFWAAVTGCVRFGPLVGCRERSW